MQRAATTATTKFIEETKWWRLQRWRLGCSQCCRRTRRTRFGVVQQQQEKVVKQLQIQFFVCVVFIIFVVIVIVVFVVFRTNFAQR